MNITIKALAPLLTTAYDLGLSVGLFGASGIAKTSVAKQLAQSLNCPFLVLDAPLTEPLLLNGLPVSQGSFATNIPYEVFRPFVETKGIILIDEISQATPLVASLLSQLLDQKRVGSLSLHPETLVIATGNRREDKAATHLLPSHILNRMDIYSVTLPSEDWIEWGYSNAINPLVLAFIKFRPDLLHNFRGEDHAGQLAFATPRSWHRLSNKLNHSTQSLESICATVGESAGVTFSSFLELAQDLPDLDYLLANPKSYERPANFGSYLALVASLSAKGVQLTDKKLIGNLLEICSQFEPEIQVMAIVPMLKNQAVFKHAGLKNFIQAIRPYLGK